MKILVTGFDPFGDDKTNPSIEAVKAMDDEILGAELIKIELPTVFHKSAEILEENIIKHKPDFILSVGQAGGRSDISIERVAINVDDARIADNAFNEPVDEKIRLDGPDAYFASLPIKAMAAEIKKVGIPASISNTAGTFVCNHIMYQGLYLANKYGSIKSGFIHVPYLPDQVIGKANTPSMSLDNIILALNTAVVAMIKYGENDLKISDGALH